MPGARVGGEQRGLLLPRHHRGRPGDQRPAVRALHFRGAQEPPDIDVDFEHERREEVIQHIYEKYGRDRAGIAATVIHYRPRIGDPRGRQGDGAVARTSPRRIASNHWGSMEAEVEDERVERGRARPDRPASAGATIKLAEQMIGMPRHLSQHVGGFILTERPLTETVPIGNGAMDDRTFIEWDKDDIEELGILKIDVLALGMLTCIRKCVRPDRAASRRAVGAGDRPAGGAGGLRHAVQGRFARRVPGREPGADEHAAAAQAALLLRSGDRGRDRPAGADPGRHGPSLSSSGGQGKEPVTFPCPDPDAWPARRAGADPRPDAGRADLPGAGDEDRARRGANSRPTRPTSCARRWRPSARAGRSTCCRTRWSGGWSSAATTPTSPQRCFDQIKGFGEYGFPESHAASFAHLVYVSSWLKWKYPAAFACGAAQFAADGLLRAGADRPRCARAWGRGARGRCESLATGIARWRTGALRLGLRQVEGCAAMRRRGWSRRGAMRPYPSRRGVAARAAGAGVAAIERLAAADAFRSMKLDRRAALWDARALKAGARPAVVRRTPRRATKGAETEVVQPARRCRSASMW